MNLSQGPNYDNPNSPFYREKKIRDYRAATDLPATLMQGETALKEKGSTYLVKRTAVETDNLFANRVEASNLVNAFQIGVSGWAGRITGQGVELSEDAYKLDIVNDIKEKADTKGNGLDVFAGQVAALGLGIGSGIILIDGPEKDNNNLSRREAKEKGLRPYFRLIDPAKDLLGFSEENGVLTELRIEETEERKSGDNSYQKKIIHKARVYKRTGSTVTVQVTEFVDNNEVPGEEIKLELGYIPVIAYIPGEQDTALTGKTPVQGLADLTRAHWNSWSLQTWVLLAARNPFLVMIGSNLDIKKIVASISTFIGIGKGKQEADCKYVEINGEGPGAGFKHVDYIEAAIRQYGVEITKPTGKELATTKIIDTEKTLSDLKGWATELESVLTDALSIACDFVNKEFPEDGATVNKEFGYNVLTNEQVQLIKVLIDAGKLPGQAVFEYVIKPNFKAFKDVQWEDIEEMMLEESRQGDTGLDGLGNLFGAGGNQ